MLSNAYAHNHVSRDGDAGCRQSRDPLRIANRSLSYNLVLTLDCRIKDILCSAVVCLLVRPANNEHDVVHAATAWTLAKHTQNVCFLFAPPNIPLQRKIAQKKIFRNCPTNREPVSLLFSIFFVFFFVHRISSARKGIERDSAWRAYLAVSETFFQGHPLKHAAECNARNAAGRL